MTEIRCYFDTETKGERDVTTLGAARYSEQPSAGIQLFSYAFDDGEVKVWDRECGEPMPADLKAAFRNKDVVFWAHNVWFDRNMIERVLKIKLPIERYRCSMAMALSHGLPGSLDDCGTILGIDKGLQKIKDGRRLVLKFCKPKKDKKTGELIWATPLTDPEDWQRYKEYCKIDVEALRAIIKKLPKWNYPYHPEELQLWFMDQRANSRGMNIDVDLANAAMSAIDAEQIRLAASTKSMTDEDVNTAGQRDEMLKHIAKRYGYDLPNMQKATLNRLVEDIETPVGLKELLLVRLSTCTTSTSKYKKLVNTTSADGRLRGAIQFSAAARTGRDGGRLFQPQNLVRPVLKHKNIQEGIKALKEGGIEASEFDVMKLTSSALRYVICAPENKKLVVADLAGIENRVLAWLAGEEWKLKAFRDFDKHGGVDMYKSAYARAFKIDPKDVTPDQRFIGKILELSMGYAGGVGAYITMAAPYNVDLDDLASKVLPSVPSNTLKESEKFYHWQNGFDIEAAKKKAAKAGESDWLPYYEPKRVYGLKQDTYAAIESLKRMWREEHPAIVRLWGDVNDAVRMAINIPSKRFYFGNDCYAYRVGNWLRITPPSSRSLCYPGMRVDNDGQLVFWGVDSYTKRWKLIKTHGGKLIENLTQGLSMSVFKHGRKLAEQSGYAAVLQVHDELVCEVPDTHAYKLEELISLMTTVPDWTPGLPLAAEGFEDYRYHK